MPDRYPLPALMKRPDGSARFAYVTFLMLNDFYLPGSLVVAYALRQMGTQADLVCLVTDEITPEARSALDRLYDRVILVDKIFVPHKRRQERQDRPWLCTRYNALRLGADGDLGFPYEKLVSLDADVLPLKHYDHLFTLDTPAGILNENKALFVSSDAEGRYVLPPDVARTGKWEWHQAYDPVCPHGQSIPAKITDRVREDPSNMGINGSLMVLTPSAAELERIRADVQRPDVLKYIGDQFSWPETQYLTMTWSGKWTSVDIRFCGFKGYPGLPVLFGTHYAGVKPWDFKREKAILRFSRYEDFRLWQETYVRMVTKTYPQLQKVRRLERLLQNIQQLKQGGKQP
jgi:glycogenin glucosyltransferase